MSVDNQRIVPLNRSVSRFTTRALQDHESPTHGASELLDWTHEDWAAASGLSVPGVALIKLRYSAPTTSGIEKTETGLAEDRFQLFPGRVMLKRLLPKTE